MTDAELLVEEGRANDAAGDIAAAERCYRDAMIASPEWSVPYYNLGLLCKYQGRWEESLEFNQLASRFAPDDEAGWWNLGIAATALGNWAEARRAWSGCGLEPPGGDGPPDFRYGLAPIRLDPNGLGEVVWARRLDPARARLLSIPLPWNPRNAGDVVLNDGAVDGYRKVNGKDVPVFNALALLEPSPLRKYVLELAASDPTAVRSLETIAEAAGGIAEHWGESTNIMCAACSRGVPHEHGVARGRPSHPHCGLAARTGDVAEDIIRRWLESEPKADLVRWYDAASAPARE